MKQKPNLPFWSLWNLSFGFFGVQIAYALQSANISRIFRTLGADPHDLSFFLDSASADGHSRPTHCRHTVRQDLVPLWTTHTLFIYWCCSCCCRHVPVA